MDTFFQSRIELQDSCLSDVYSIPHTKIISRLGRSNTRVEISWLRLELGVLNTIIFKPKGRYSDSPFIRFFNWSNFFNNLEVN